jgi:hypothetical protein
MTSPVMLPPGFSIEGFRSPRMTTQAVGEDGGMVDPIHERTPEDLITAFKELRGGGGASTMAVGEDDSGGMMPSPLNTDFGPPPSGGTHFATMAIGEESDIPAHIDVEFAQPEPFEPPSQSRTTELIEELISLLRGSRSPPSVFDRRPPQVGQIGQPTRRAGDPMSSDIPLDPMVEMSRFLRETSNPVQQAAPRPPPPVQQAGVSGIGTLNDLASNPLFQDFATQLQSSNPRQSEMLGNLFQQANKSNQRQQQNQFQPQSNPFMSNSSPFMAPPQFFSPQAYGQFAPPPQGFSQFQPPIPYGNAGGFAPPPPQFAPMQHGTGSTSPFASSIRNVGFAMMQ